MASKKISFSNSENQNSKGLETVFGYQPKKKENKTTFEMVPIESISLDPKGEFQQLYPLEEENICNISESMKKKGFLNHQPLVLIFIEEENSTFLGDGHNRLEGALRAKITVVPVVRLSYATRREAKIAMLELQINRRQLTDSMKMKSVMLLMELRGEKKEKNSSGKKSEIIADQTGMSSRQVEKINSIAKSENPELIEAVKNGKKSISKAYKELHPQKKYTNDNTSHLDTLDSKDGNPFPLYSNHSDGIERPSGLIDPVQDSIRTNERKAAYEEGFKNGFVKAALYVISCLEAEVAISYVYENIFCRHSLEYDCLTNYNMHLTGQRKIERLRKNAQKKGLCDHNPSPVIELPDDEDEIIRQNATFDFDDKTGCK